MRRSYASLSVHFQAIALSGCGKTEPPVALNFSKVASEPFGQWQRVGVGGETAKFTVEKQQLETEIKGHRHHSITTSEPILGRTVIGVWMGVDKRGHQVVEWLYTITEEGIEYRKTVIERVAHTDANSLVLIDDWRPRADG